jgi:hypothetical protein
MKTITYIRGDATKPNRQSDDETIHIAHVCNDIGAWGKGFVVPLGKRWPISKSSYRSIGTYNLGTNQYVSVGPNIIVVNMIGQHGIYRDKVTGISPIRYYAINECLTHLANQMVMNKPCSVHMPKIGSGLAGGNWKTIESLIEKILCEKDIDVFVYELPKCI